MPENVIETAALYTNQKGQPVTHTSYSSRQTYKHCPRQFQLERVEGWSDKLRRAAPEFGKAIEAAVQHFEATGRAAGEGIAKFAELWEQATHSEYFKEWEYTDSEVSWEQLMNTGKDLLLLYQIRAPFLPISTTPKALWQQSVRKKLFPGTHLDKLENKAILDIFSFPRWDHPLLPNLEFGPCNECTWKSINGVTSELVHICTQHSTRSLIIDVKTSGMDLDTELIALDPQLSEYAWQLRVPDVAFLWFVKKSPDWKKGSRVTLVEDAGDYHAGFELLVLYDWAVDKTDTVVLGTQEVMAAYNQVSKDAAGKTLTGNALKAVKLNFIATPGVVHVLPSVFTKQRLQFAAARLTQQQMDETGRSVAQTTVEMLRANQEQFWPQLAGVRFPNQKCNFCSMRHICLGNVAKRDELLSKRGEEWLDAKWEAEEAGA